MKEDFFLLLMVSKHWMGIFFPGSRGSRLNYKNFVEICQKKNNLTECPSVNINFSSQSCNCLSISYSDPGGSFQYGKCKKYCGDTQ